jgi:hypothetical protein
MNIHQYVLSTMKSHEFKNIQNYLISLVNTNKTVL